MLFNNDEMLSEFGIKVEDFPPPMISFDYSSPASRDSTSYNEDIENAECVIEMVKFMENRSGQKCAINELGKLQKTLKQWQEDNFAADCTGPEWMALGASEELGEVAHVIVKAKQKIREHQAGLSEESLAEVADGVADTVIYLIQLCSHLGINFGEALFSTAENVLKRDWKKNRTDGVST